MASLELRNEDVNTPTLEGPRDRICFNSVLACGKATSNQQSITLPVECDNWTVLEAVWRSSKRTRNQEDASNKTRIALLGPKL